MNPIVIDVLVRPNLPISSSSRKPLHPISLPIAANAFIVTPAIAINANIIIKAMLGSINCSNFVFTKITTTGLSIFILSINAYRTPIP
ncbi:MAG: hypothetical protein DRO15_01260 [Thermoprotei archaeon]|nr:MAG: hypothetical protein DRO15_01260 [Thermoprotei archaeon]